MTNERIDDKGARVVEKLLQGLTKDFVMGNDKAADEMVAMLKKYNAPLDKVADMLEKKSEELTKKTFSIFDNPLKKTPAGNAADRMITLADYIRSKTEDMNEDKYDEPASSYESEMLDNQVAFIKYASDEICDHVKNGGVFPEWFQNKFSGVHEQLKTLHAYMEGERQQEAERKRMMSMKDMKDDYFESLERKLNESKGICKECGKPSYTTLPEEKQKGVDGKVCWKGYKRMGTKKKGGKTVDNCVKM